MNAVPSSSADVSSSTVRKPMRRSQVSRRSSSRARRRARTAAARRSPTGHHRAASGPRRRARPTTRRRRPCREARRRRRDAHDERPSAPSRPERSTSTCTATVARTRSTVTSGRTDARRAVRQRSTRRGLPEAGGLQVRAPVPAEAAGHLADHVERCGYAPGRAPMRSPPASACVERAGEVDRERLGCAGGQVADVEPVAAVLVRGAADSAPPSVIVATVSRPSNTRSTRSSSAAGSRSAAARTASRAAHPREVVLVAVEVRVGDQAGVRRAVCRAGHLGGDAPAGDGPGTGPAARAASSRRARWCDVHGEAPGGYLVAPADRPL